MDTLKQKFPSVKIIPLQKNYGFATGYNVGLAEISEPYVCLLNSDVEVTEDWLRRPLQLLKENVHIAAVQPKVKSYLQKDYFEFAGAAGGQIDLWGYPYCHGRDFFRTERDMGQYEVERKIFWASGCCFFTRTELLRKYGGLDEDFFAHQEEIDLCWRWQNDGYEVYYTPNSTVYHVGGGTLQYKSPQKTYLNFRNNLYMLLKNLPGAYLFPIIFTRLCLDGMAAIYLALKDGPAHIGSVFRAHMSFYKNLLRMYRKRGAVQRSKYYGVTSIIVRSLFK